jgi:hypothetical protein
MRYAVLFIVLFLLPWGAYAQLGTDADRLDHREDFDMNFIGGSDFRNYISGHVHEDDRWAHAMRTFGTFHNHMHEMMTLMALYASHEMDNGGRVPEVGERISGGEWTAYRKNFEADDVRSAWHDLVRITEIMHDRVHHAMFKAVVYDVRSRERAASITDYAGDDIQTTYRVLPAPGEANLQLPEPGAFREFAWHGDFDGRYAHASAQAMMTFHDMLYNLMDQWAAYSREALPEACSFPATRGPVTAADWAAYSVSVSGCDVEPWRELVLVTGFMHDRIQHMLYMMMRYASAERK